MPRPTLNNYTRVPDTQINFGDILEQDQSENISSAEHSNFFSQNNHHSLR